MMQKRELELLAPAGSYETFEAVIRAGADAVYLGGSHFGARAYANNFNEEELLRAIDYAHIHGRQVYLTVNTLFKEEELEQGLYEYLLPYYEQGLDAVIVQDMGAFARIRSMFPRMDIHTSTQMTVTGAAGAAYMKQLGASRVVMAREMSFAEIREIHDKVGIEIESFVHGALCYCYSGQCLLSSMLGGRSGNRGRCAQPCRLPYEVYKKDQKSRIACGNYVLSPKDLCTIDAIPALAESGIFSFKIEGRMKSIHYVSTVTNCYKAAVNAYLESPEKFEAIKQDLVDEMWKVAQRELATGFYYHTPTENEQLFGARRKIPEYKFVAEVVAYDAESQTATIRQRNVIHEGDQVEFYGPGFSHFETFVTDLRDADGNKIDRAPNPMELLTIHLEQPVEAGDMVRARKEGLINLYKEDGTSVTVRA